jgi:hypothetical protein
MVPRRKPVIVRMISSGWHGGYAEVNFGQNTSMDLLDLSGKLLHLDWSQIKWVCLVRDFPATALDPVNPERLLHKKFSLRPRTPGLWLRLNLADGDELEGIAANDRSLIAGSGLLLTPPDTRSITQRIFVPLVAIQSLEVVALIGASGRRRTPAPQNQPELFPSGPQSLTQL